ncbi:MAG: aminopeptidase N [Pseudomonadota bacterium]
MKTDTPPFIRLENYRPPEFLIDHLNLDVRLDGPRTTAEARWTFRRNPIFASDPRPALIGLDAAEYSSVDLIIEGRLAEVRTKPGSLSFEAPEADAFDVLVRTVLDPDENKALSGLYRTGGVYCTQCEAEGFRRIIPFLDRPDVLATYTVRVSAQKQTCPVLLSNGNPVEHLTLEDGWHQMVWHDPHPKPSYLFALVGGQLDKLSDQFTTAEERTVDLGIYVEADKAPQAEFAMKCLKRSMRWDEQRFGRGYDLDVFNIVAVSDFNLGAMENKGLNIFNDKYILASPETATDEDYRNIDAIIAHEYFHNWTGNRITCRDWFQLCLKEGLTVFRDQEYSADIYDRTLKRIADVRMLWAHQFPEDNGPLAHPARPSRYKEINNFYTATVYEKGAEIVRMMALFLGEERFRAAMDRYFETYDGQAVRVEEFVQSMREEAADLGEWPDFMGWYTQSGTPKVDVDIKRTSDGLICAFNQKTDPTADQADKRPLPIPCTFSIVSKTGSAIGLGKGQVSVRGGRYQKTSEGSELFLLEAESGQLQITGLPSDATCVSLFQGFSAPITTQIAGVSAADQLFLAKRDPSTFNRWLHLQELLGQALQEIYQRLRVNEPPAPEPRLFDAMLEQLANLSSSSNDMGLRAASLTLPATSELVRAIGKDIDPQLIVDARDGFSKAFSAYGRTHLIQSLELLGVEDDGFVEPQSAARRSLIVSLLDHLARQADPEAQTIIERAHAKSRGMTMRIKTLGLLIRSQHSATEGALNEFEARFADNALAMDKWLSVQATSYGRNAPEVVERLMNHPAFSLENPNRVRALVGSFASGNLVGFHREDGAGYELVGQAIGKIDRANPQLAARLCAAFRSWKQFAPIQREKAAEVLRGMKAIRTRSPDLDDIVDRTLEG